MKKIIIILLTIFAGKLFAQDKMITEKVLSYSKIKYFIEEINKKDPKILKTTSIIKIENIKKFIANPSVVGKSFTDDELKNADDTLKSKYYKLYPERNIGWAKSEQSGQEGKLTNALSLFGADWQASMITGMTDFLLQRAKDEFTYAFIDDLIKLFEKQEKDETSTIEIKKDLRLIFKNFYRILKSTDQFSYKNYVPAFRVALIEDYNNLPYSIIDVSIDHIPQLNNKDKAKALLKILFDRIKEITKKEDPFIALSKLSVLENEELHSLDPNCEEFKILKFIGILAREYYYIANSDISIGNKKIKKLSDFFEDPINRKLFIYFLFDEFDKPKLSSYLNGITLNKELALFKISNNLSTIHEIINNLNNNISDSSNYAANYIKYLNTFSSTLVSGSEIINSNDPQWVTFIEVFDIITKIQTTIMEKNFNQAIVLFINLLKPEVVSSKTLRIMTFTANLAEVKNEEDVINAFKTFADPVGSFRYKRIKGEKNLWSVSINSYLGYNVGQEWLISSVDSINNTSNFYQSIYLPIGFEIDICTKGSWFPSIGIFASPIDLGTLASYRAMDNKWDSLTVSNNDKISFKNIFAPSAAIVLGISKNKPITLSFGYQYAPEQRILKDNVLNIEDKINVHHWFVNLAIDLTLFNF